LLCDSGRWTGVGQGWIEDIIIEDDLWIAGTITGGLYRSTNNGKKWNKIDKDTLQFGTTGLLLAGDVIYRGTGLTHYDKDLGIGILKSKDKRKTWQETGLKFDKNQRNPVWDIACNASRNVLAAGKFFKSINGGESWTDITQNLPILAWHYITSISSNPTNLNEVYVSLGKMDDSYLNKVYQSEDGGMTWKNVSTGIPPYETFKIEHIPNSSGVILASLGGLFYKNDNLDQWIRLEGKIPPIAIRDFVIDIENRKIIVSTYGNGLWQMKMPRRMLRY
jgi:photosystem II stability/assembly factor-like uncharacterized protein